MKRHLKIFLPPLTSVVLFGITVFLLVLPTVEEAIMAKKQEMLRELTSVAMNVLGIYREMERTGRLTGQEARECAIETIRNLRYGAEGKDYFWINDTRPYMVMHPFRSDLEGRDLANFQDPEGKYLFNETVKIVGEKGAGFLTYSWQWKDDPNRIVPKLSYVALFNDWDWIVGTGIYLEDVRLGMNKMTGRLTLVGAGVFLLVTLLTSYIIYQGVRIERERKAANDKLIETLEEHRAVLECSPNPIVVYDTDGRTTYINPAFTRVFGYHPEELLGKTIDFVPDNYKSETTAVIEDLYGSEERVVSKESQRLTKDKKLLDVTIGAAIFRDRNEKAMGMVVTFTDITKLKEYEEALRESEEKFRSISSNALDGIAMLDPKGRITFWNTAAEKMFGYTYEDLKDTDFLLLLAPRKYHQIYLETLSSFKNTGTDPAVGKTLELSALRQGGEEFPIELSVSPIKLHGQWYFIGIVRDITRRKMDEARLIKSEAGLAKAQAIARLGSWEWEVSTGKVVCSEEMYHILGLDRDGFNVTRDGFINAIHPEDRPHVEESIKQTLYENRPYSLEFRIVRPDGSVRFVNEKAEVVYDENHDPILVLGTTQDITDRKRTEEEKIKLEAQLRQAHKMEAIGTLAGGIAHDFNNILSSIIGYTEMAAMTLPEDAQAREDLGDVLESANRARDLVRQILTFSRQGEQEWQAIELGSAINAALKFIRSSLPATIDIRFTINTQNDAVMADLTQLHQILINLGTNAAQAMRDEGGVLEVRLDELELVENQREPPAGLAPGRYLQLTVKDNGHGMTPEVMDRIFDPFFTTKGRGEGTGMGLAVVHGIVESHGGSITVESTLGQGSTFCIFFPQYHGRMTFEPDEEEAAFPRGTERILFIDDEEYLVDIWSRSLSELGYQVAATTDNQAALELFRSAPDDYDLIITDQTMPNMTGLEITRKIKRIKPEQKIIICTGFSETVDEEKAKNEGVSEFLLKPITMAEMAKAVRRVFGGNDL